MKTSEKEKLYASKKKGESEREREIDRAKLNVTIFIKFGSFIMDKRSKTEMHIAGSSICIRLHIAIPSKRI